MRLHQLSLFSTMSHGLSLRPARWLLLALGLALLSTPGLAQETVFGPVVYTRSADRPDLFTASFTARAGQGILRVTTGDQLGSPPATSAIVIVNGATVLSPREFDGGAADIELEFPLASDNTLRVELRGAPGSQLRIEIAQAFEEDVPAWRMPELAITQAVASPSLADPGDTVNVAATVQNVQRGTTEPVALRITVDSLDICNQSVPPLGPAESVSFSCDWTASTPGRHLVRAQLDVPEQAFDGSLSNNIAIALIEVAGESDPAPRVEVILEGLDSIAFEQGGSYALPVKLRNASFAGLTNLVVAYFVDGGPVCTIPPGPLAAGTRDVFPQPIPCFDAVESLGPAEEISLTLPWSDVTEGEHVISVAVLDLQSEAPVLASRGWIVVIPDQTLLYDLPGPGQWASIGPKTLHNVWTGRITSVAFDPTNPLMAFASGTGGDNDIPAAAGVWKTVNGGLEWFPVGDRLPSLQIRNLAVDPNHPSIVYASGPEGLFKSINGGANWSLFAAASVIGDSKLYVGTASSGEALVYAGTAVGLKRYKSANPWSKTSTAADWTVIKQGAVRDLVVHPDDSSTVYVAANNSIFRTTQAATMDPESGGSYWTDLRTQGKGLPPSLVSVSLGLHEQFPQRIYAGIAKPGTTDHAYAIYRSDDGGDSWSELVSYPTGFLTGGLYNPFLRVVPVPDPGLEILYFGGVDLYQFINESTGNLKKKTFRVKTLFSVDTKDLEFVPKEQDEYYWLADDQGVFRCRIETTPELLKDPKQAYGVSGDVCEARSLNLRVTELYDIDVSRLDPNRIIGGTQDTGTILYQGDPSWSVIKGGDGQYSLFNPYDDTIMYAQYQAFNDDNGTARKANGDGKWHKVVSDQPSGLGFDRGFITMAPDQPDLLIGIPDGETLYYHPAPGSFPGVPWQSYSLDAETNGKAMRVLAHRVTASQSAWWLVGTDLGKIIVPWPAGSLSSLETVFTHPLGYPVKSIAASPVNPQVIFVLFGTGSKTSIFRIVLDTTDPTLSTSTEITYNFPTNVKTWTICGDPRSQDVAYVGTSRGVLWLDPAATNSFVAWQPFNDGLPLTSVVELVSVPTDYSVVAATKGRGAWRMIAP